MTRVYLVTGAAGFIGYFVSLRLLSEGHSVVGIDNLNDYYSVALKKSRLQQLESFPNFQFELVDIADRTAIAELFQKGKFSRVIHLAAQAGVRYSIENPLAYIDSNIVGQANILEGCRHNDVEHLVYASSSSVYGMNEKMPFSTDDPVDHPVSLYAATKKADELMSHTYSHLYGLPTTGLRFFTVYGPWGRPDMAPMKFAKAILQGQPIDIYNNGELARDFTFIDDIVEGIIRIQDVVPHAATNGEERRALNAAPGTSSAPYRVYNIGNGAPVPLMDFIQALETSLGVEAVKNFMPMQPGDVYKTWADTEGLFNATGYTPQIGIEEGVERFVRWYKSYFGF